MKTSRLLIHEDNCPDKKSKVLKMCPFNPMHKMNPETYESHKKVCPQKPIVDKEIEKELKEYLASNRHIIGQNMPSIKKESNVQTESTTNNFTCNSNDLNITKAKQKGENIISNTVGIRNDILDKNNKKEKKKEQKKCFN